MTYLAIIIGKLAAFFTRTLKIGGGSAAPGLIALKIDPNLVQNLSKKLNKNVVITGTNGKTTTAKMLAHFAHTANLKVIRNATGSNLERGIASTLISHVNLLGNFQKTDMAIWELDEAAFNSVAPKLNPDVIVFLNAFRDQLDRYGEVNSIIKNWSKTLHKTPKSTQIIINGDDANVSKLQTTSEAFRFGLEKFKITGETLHDNKSVKLDIIARQIKNLGLEGTSFQVVGMDQKSDVNLKIPGIYHIYDFLAAFSTGLILKLPAQQMIESMQEYTPAFGRVEKINLKDNQEGFIFLIKNPTGANQVLETITPNLTAKDTLLLALNDNLADGTDVSWIWDTQFEKLTMPNAQLTKKKPTPKFSIVNSQFSIICSGTRALDLANRLKYAGIDPTNLRIETNLEAAFQLAQKNLTGKLFILPTYTAMLELQKHLAKTGIKKEYWKEL